MAVSKYKCKFCGEYFPAGSVIKLPAGRFCTYQHATEFGRQQVEKKKAKAAAAAKKIEQDRKKANFKAKRDFNRNDLRWQHKQTQLVFNRMRKLEELLWFKEHGLEPVCISCGKPLGNDQWCAGHFKTRGAQSNLRYDPKNVYLQHNKYCNMELSGDIAGTKNTMGYRKGLIHRFGEEEGQAIIDYCEANTKPHKWTCEEVEQIRKECNKRIRELETVLNID